MNYVQKVLQPPSPDLPLMMRSLTVIEGGKG
jgi:hypothetical protein